MKKITKTDIQAWIVLFLLVLFSVLLLKWYESQIPGMDEQNISSIQNVSEGYGITDAWADVPTVHGRPENS